MRVFWAVLFLLLASPASANHEDNRAVFQYGAWSGWANYKAGGFDFCWMSAPYRSGMVMGFALGRTLKWAILFVREEGFPPSAPAQFQLYIDGRHAFTGYAENFGTGLVIPLPDSAALMRAMRAGNALTVVSSYGTSTFSLAGTSRAFVELYGCVKQHSQIAGGGAFGGGSSGGAFGGGGMTQPAPGRRNSASLEDYRVPREDVLPVMADIFAENGGRAYKFMPYEANRAIGDVVWQWPDSSLGGIVVYRDSAMPDVTLADEEEKVLRDLSSACQSRFVHERRAPPGRDANGFEVRRLFAYCSGAPNSAYFVYSLILKPGRLYVKLVAARIGTSPPADPFSGDLGYAQDSILRRFSTQPRQ